jgi:hypothetical protein
VSLTPEQKAEGRRFRDHCQEQLDVKVTKHTVITSALIRNYRHDCNGISRGLFLRTHSNTHPDLPLEFRWVEATCGVCELHVLSPEGIVVDTRESPLHEPGRSGG